MNLIFVGNSKVSKGGSSSNTASLPDQFARDKGFEKRAQYYAAKAYSSQAHKGDQDLKDPSYGLTNTVRLRNRRLF